jgi:hypothetical protein
MLLNCVRLRSKSYIALLIFNWRPNLDGDRFQFTTWKWLHLQGCMEEIIALLIVISEVEERSIRQ